MKNRIIVLAFLAIVAIVAIGGYFVMPTNECEQCFEKIKIGMKYQDADRILNEHGFSMTMRWPNGPIEMWTSYVHDGEKRRNFNISILCSYDGVLRKKLPPRHSAIRQFLACFNIK